MIRAFRMNGDANPDTGGDDNMVSASSVLGAEGEHDVLRQLPRRGMIAARAPVGVPHCDSGVTDDTGDRLCAIQVKTRVEKGSDGGWLDPSREGWDKLTSAVTVATPRAAGA